MAPPCITALAITLRRLILAMERNEDRKLARYVLDKTGSMTALKDYSELRKAERRALDLTPNSAEATAQRASEPSQTRSRRAAR